MKTIAYKGIPYLEGPDNVSELHKSLCHEAMNFKLLVTVKPLLQNSYDSDH